MPGEVSPLAAFETWLPGELEYSARKAGYDKKIERARLPLDDNRSIYGFLGSEWFAFQRLRRLGVQHLDEHAKSAQLQLAKFAAGLFDKAALGLWMISGGSADEESFVAAAQQQADLIRVSTPWEQHQQNKKEFANTLDAQFEQTIFSFGIERLMQMISNVADRTDSEREKDTERLIGNAMLLGGYATRCYETYAYMDLAPEQYDLPISRLEGETK